MGAVCIGVGAVLVLTDAPHAGKTSAPPRHKSCMAKHHSPVGLAGCPRRGAPADVTGWRRCRLLEAGFDRALAERLAESRSVDLHALLQLVDRGCPPALAARILAPIDDAGAPA